MHRQADFFLAGIIKNRRGHEQITKGDKFSMEYHDDSILHECQVKLNIPREQEYSLKNLQEFSGAKSPAQTQQHANIVTASTAH